MNFIAQSSFDLADPRIIVLHENEEWVVPLKTAFEELNLPYEEWFINEGQIDINALPPNAIFYNRMSASSHTRDHRYAVELSGPILAWLEANNKTVINSRRALQLEIRKIEQYISLEQQGIKTPKTIAAVGKQQVIEAARQFSPNPFILKPNRGGKGAGVQLFYSIESLEVFLNTIGEDYTLDGVFLVQEYIQSHDGSITRMEFIGGKFYYAVKVDTGGSFELCPADACEIGDDFCPTTPDAKESSQPKFTILEDLDIPEIAKAERFLAANGIQVAGIEFVQNAKGERYVYDVNINTNYNSPAESVDIKGRAGMKKLAQFLGEQLEELVKDEQLSLAI